MVATTRYYIPAMTGPDDVNSLIYNCRRAMEMKSKLQLVLSQTKGIFPNGAVPMAVALQYFQRRGLQVITSEVSPEVARTHFLDPRSVTDSALQNSPVKNVIWRYRNEREA